MNTLTRTLWWAVRPLWFWRLVRLLVRSLWLAGLVALGGWLLTAGLGRTLGGAEWTLLGLGAFIAIFLAQALWPVRSVGLAHRLDRRYALLDQLTAAYEVAERGPRNYVERDLLTAADDTLRDLHRQWRFKLALPWNDLLLAGVVGAALVAVGYGLAAREAAPPPNVTHAAYEALPPVGLEPMVDLPGVPVEYQTARPGQVAPAADPATAAEASAALSSAAAAQEVLDALAEALSEPSLTQGAGQALAEGDSERAADQLRALAQQAESLSDEAKAALAGALGQAADRLQSAAPETADELRADGGGLLAADSNEAANNAAAADALESVAQLIEQADGQRTNPTTDSSAGGATGDQDNSGEAGQGTEGADGQPGDSGNSAGANGTASDRGAPESDSTGSLDSLRATGSAVTLPPGESLDPGSLRPAENPGQAHSRRSVPYVYLDASGAGGAQPSDPLSIPWRLRNVIQRYFSPP